jgi:hypothetical protein
MRAITAKHPLNNIYLTWTDQAYPHRWVYVQKWKQTEFIPASYHILDCHMSSLLPFTCVAWIIWSQNQAPMESRKTELCNKLYKTEEEEQIFLGFWFFETRTEENSKQSKIFLDFSNIKPKTASKANQS